MTPAGKNSIRVKAALRKKQREQRGQASRVAAAMLRHAHEAEYEALYDEALRRIKRDDITGQVADHG